MEIDISDFVWNQDPFEFSASRMELGDDAGRITWENAKRQAAAEPLLKTPEDCDAFRDWAKGFGAWDDKERATWIADDCNALLIQFISGDLRELESLAPSDDNGEGIDWTEAQRLDEAGTITISGWIFKGDIEGTPDFGRIFFSMDD
jgi:hypothetical protein